MIFPICSLGNEKEVEKVADSLYVKGISAYKNKTFDKAICYFKESRLLSDSINRKEPFYSSNANHWESAAYYILGDTVSAYNLSSEYMMDPVDQRLTIVSDSLWAISHNALLNNDFENAINSAQCAILNEKHILGDTHFYVANSYVYLSDIYLKKGDIGKYQESLMSAIDLFNKLGNPHTDFCIKAYVSLFYIYSDDEKYHIAIEYGEKIRSLFYNYCQDGEKAIISHELSVSYSKINKFKEAYALCSEALNYLEILGQIDTPFFAECIHDAGLLVLQGKNDSVCFSRYMQKALAIKEHINGKSQDYYWTMECFARGYYYLAEREDFPKNMTLLEHAIELYETIPNHELIENYRTSLNNLSVFYQDVNLEKSIDLCEKLLSIERKYEVGDTILTLSNLADCYKDIDVERALYYANIVLRVRENSEPLNYDNIRIAHFRLATVYSRSRQFENAIFHSKKALDYAKTIYGTLSEKYVTSLQNLGAYYFLKGDTLTALNYNRQAYLNPYGNKQSIALNLAATFSALNMQDSCYKYTKESWELHCSDFVNTIINLSKENRFSYVIRPINYAQICHPINYMLHHENNIDFRKLAFNSALFSKDIVKKCMTIDKGDNYYKEGFESIKSSLKEKEVVVEFWENKNSIMPDSGALIVFIVRSEYDSPKIVKLSKDEITRSLKNENPTTGNSLPMYDNIWKEIIETAQIQECERIYISLDGNLEKIPVELIMGYDYKYVGDKYDIIRVSSTSEIPKLKNPETGSNAVLYGGLKYNSDPKTVLDKNFSIYGSTRSITENLFDELSDSLISDLRSATQYLPWTKIEVDTASYYLKKSQYSDVTVIGDDYGTEESFKALSGNSPSIIHIATHGYIGRSTVPTNSWWEMYDYFMENTSLLFSGVLTTASINKDTLLVEDGILRSSEISVLNLSNTQLLVLSACNSGLGGSSPLGNIGLVRAFKTAGVGTVLMTLNYVDDSACFYMMKYFYESLSLGYSKHESFKIAQRKLRAMEEYKEFIYWGNFVMID